MLRRLHTLSVTVKNLAIVTHEVPAERVRPHIPTQFQLDTFASPRGEEHTLVSATCFCDDRFRWSGSPYPAHTFNETTYRTYVTYKGRRSIFFVGRYLGTPLAVAGQRVFDRHVWLADFDLAINGGAAGYSQYELRASSEKGATQFSVRAVDVPAAKHPFATGEEHAQFITYRLEGLFTSSAGFAGRMPVEHRRMRPLGGDLLEGQFDLWQELGVLLPEETMSPFSVLIEPEVDFTLFPVRLAP